MRRFARQASLAAAIFVVNAANAAVILDHFDAYEPGQLPGGGWADIASAIRTPTLSSPTGTIVETFGAYGNPTRAFQITRATGTSQGIIASIDAAPTHTLAGDLRIDAHPSREVYGNWNAAFGFIQDRGIATDINFNPQGLIYVYQQKWWFFGATVFGGNSTEILLSNAIIQPGAWYHVTLDADTTSGQFQVNIMNSAGEVQVDRTVAIPNWNPAMGRYNRVAAFDGDYARAAVVSGQFTVDNIYYLPSPSAAAFLLPGAFIARRRRC